MDAAQWLLLIGVSGLLMYYALPRGIRNNNPGNIRRGSSRWAGMSPVQTDDAFVQFETPEYGIRAMAVLLRNYQSQGFGTIYGMIGKWAPDSDGNDSMAYAEFVAMRSGVMPSEPVELELIMVPMLAAMIQYENGVQPYSLDTIGYAASMVVAL